MDTGNKLGEYLRSEREKRQITIEQVASATKINVKLLHALESDNYDALPAKPFVRGFVANYARYIGLDPRTIIEQFESYLDDNAGKKFKRPDNMPHIFVEKDMSVDRSRTVLAGVMGAFLVVGIVAIVLVKPSMKKHHHGRTKITELANSQVYTVPLPPSEGSVTLVTTAPKATPTPVAPPAPTHSPAVVAGTVNTKKPEALDTNATHPAIHNTVSQMPLILALPTPTPKASPSPKPTPTPKASPLPKPTPSPSASVGADAKKPPPIPDKEVKHLVIVRAKEDSWVKYQSDDRPLMAFMLKKDKVIYIRARDSIRFMSGNPKGVEYSYNRGAFTVFKEQERSLIYPESAATTFKDHMFTE